MYLFNILLKDLKVFFRDKKALILLILMPIILATILSFSLSGVFNQSFIENKIKVGVVKAYDVQESKEKVDEMIDLVKGDVIDPEKIFFEDFLENEELQSILSYEIIDEEEIHKKIREEEYSGVILLPEDYYRKMLINFNSGYKSEIDIKLVVNSSQTISSDILEKIVNGFNNQMNTILIAKNTYIEYAFKNSVEEFETEIEELMTSLTEETDQIDVTFSRIQGLTPVNSKSYYSVGMVGMFLLFTSGYGSTLLLDEKKRGTYNRLISTGASQLSILISKFIVVFMISFVQIIAMVVFSTVVLNVSWGNISTNMVYSVFASLSIAALGMFFALITMMTQNYKLNNILQGGVFQLLAFFGGSYIPIETLPKIFSKIRMFLLNGVILDGYIKITMGYTLADIQSHINILLINIFILFIGIIVLRVMVIRNGKYY